MKVLNVMLTTRMGGLEQVFLDYTNSLQSHCDIIPVLHTQSPIIPKLRGHFYGVHNFSKHDPIALFKFLRIVQKESPDIIISHGNRAHYMMKKISGKIPVIGVSHNYSFDHIKNCDYIISISKDMIRHLIDLNYPMEKIFHIPNMIMIPEDIQYAHPILQVPPVIGMIARFDKIKGVDIFIKALNLLKERNVAFKAKIAGNGPEYENIKTLIEDLKLSNYIEIVGWVEDRKDFYNNIDILCVPSRVEPFGIVILEGLMYSKPIIISNLPGPMEIVKKDVEALVFKSEDFMELAYSLERLLKEEDLVKNLSYNGFKRLSLYSFDTITKKILNSLNKVNSQSL